VWLPVYSYACCLTGKWKGEHLFSRGTKSVETGTSEDTRNKFRVVEVKLLNMHVFGHVKYIILSTQMCRLL